MEAAMRETAWGVCKDWSPEHRHDPDINRMRLESCIFHMAIRFSASVVKAG